jgi:hypothetical protein
MFDEEDTVDELPLPPRKEILPADRELLELAARALGATFHEVDGEGYGNLHFGDGSIVYAWNSLVHSDDAFNLSVKRRLDVVHNQDDVVVKDGHVELARVDYGDDDAAATRRAVTCAAAEIGKSAL